MTKKKSKPAHSHLAKRAPEKQKSEFEKLIENRATAAEKKRQKVELGQQHLENAPTLTSFGVKNQTKIASVLQSKAVMKKDSKYRKLFKLDDDDDAGNPLDRAHIGTRV